MVCPAGAQLVPEGVHSDPQGRSSMCGIVGDDALDLMRQVRASPSLNRSPIDTDRFELFVSEGGLTQWVFTTPGEAAYPAVTCRLVYQERDGSWLQTRAMRCDASREACDELFLEFQALDEQVRQEIRGNR
jgi:hypothetical protein